MSTEVIYPADIALLGRLSDERKAEFCAYMAAMDQESVKRGNPYGAGSLWETTGAECWFNYFDEGFSPTEAFDEDLSYSEIARRPLEECTRPQIFFQSLSG